MIDHLERGTVAVLAALVLAGCPKDDDDDGDDSPGSDSGSSWLVGDDGEMLRMAKDGVVEPYALAEDADLNAIACLGASAAWVVGSAGTVISTADAGATWQRHELDVAGDLLAVAIGEAHHGGEAVIVIAGDDGVVLERRGDRAFTRLAAPEIDWTAVATDETGETITLAGADGSLWRTEDGAAAQVFVAEGASFHGLGGTHEGDRLVAVGSAGLVVVSDDAGETWAPVAVPTSRDLHAVRMSSDGSAIIAVGDAGTVVTIDPTGVTASEQLDPALSLRGLHMHSSGSGHAVGDAGIVLFTGDVGRTWVPVDTGTDAILRGVDDVHLGAHW
jgi:photosystem II stability/assembly factor-like uncharacterized protein